MIRRVFFRRRFRGVLSYLHECSRVACVSAMLCVAGSGDPQVLWLCHQVLSHHVY